MAVNRALVIPRRTALFNHVGIQLKPTARNRVHAGNLVKVQIAHDLPQGRMDQAVPVRITRSTRGRLAILEGIVDDREGVFTHWPDYLQHGATVRFPRRAIINIADNVPENRDLRLDNAETAYTLEWDGPVPLWSLRRRLTRRSRRQGTQTVDVPGAYAKELSWHQPITDITYVAASPDPDEVTLWNGDVLQPQARALVRVGNIVRVTMVQRSLQGDIWCRKYVRITACESAPGGMLQGKVDYADVSSLTYNPGPNPGDLVAFPRTSIQEIPAQWSANRNIRRAVMQLRTGTSACDRW